MGFDPKMADSSVASIKSSTGSCQPRNSLRSPCLRPSGGSPSPSGTLSVAYQ